MTAQDPRPRREQRPLVSVRAALILTIAILAAVATTGLMLAAGHHSAEALLAGLCASGSTVAAAPKLIG